MSQLEVLKRITIKDKNGKIKYDSGLLPSHSYTIAFIEHLYCAMKDTGVSIENTSNVSKTINSPSSSSNELMKTDGNDNDSGMGIVVGSGTTAEDNEDYALDTQISHGTGAGELDYGAHSFTAPSEVSGNVDLVMSRDFYNGSGGSVTVNEIGVYCKTYDGSSLEKFCILRDVLGSSQAVADTETLTVQYTLRTTV